MKAHYQQVLAILFVAWGTSWLAGQAIRPMRPFSTEGKIKQVARGNVVMTDKSGRAWQLRLAGSDGVVSLGNNRKFQARKPIVEVSGSLGQADLKKGMTVQFKCFVSDKGRVREPVSDIKWVDESKAKPGAKLNKKETNDREETQCLVTGTIDRVDPKGFMVRIPRSRLADKGMLAVPLAKDAKLSIRTRDLSKAREGDAITEVSGVELSTGDFVIQKIAVRLVKKQTETPGRSGRRKSTEPVAEVLDAKYDQLSDDPLPAPRMVRDRFLRITTDLSDRKTRVLLDKLTKELTHLARFYGRVPSAPIDCHIVADQKKWSSAKLPPKAAAAITDKQAELVPQSGGSGSRSKKMAIYAPSNTSLIRAELVSAYCYQAFGGVGPDWYNEGMQEVGKYWEEPLNEVQVDQALLRALAKSKGTKSLKDILSDKPEQPETAADESMSNADKRRRESARIKQEREHIAYRWALCYMLAHNPNYQRKFQELGKNLMMEREASLKDSFGKVSKQLAFELNQFTQNVENGYRTDLCAWRWKHRFKPVEKAKTLQTSVQAKLGWQPVALVEKDTAYDMVTRGKWRIDGAGTEASAAGDKEGVGQLVAVILQEDYTLTDPLPIGKGTSFSAPATGKLYARCSEKWGGLADNAGKVTAYIRHAKKKK